MGQLAIGLLPDILKHGVGGQGLYTYSAALTYWSYFLPSPAKSAEPYPHNTNCYVLLRTRHSLSVILNIEY